jgi:hypothetical protein
MASHAFGAVQDVRADREAGIKSVATAIGARNTVRFAFLLYFLAGISIMNAGPHGMVAALAAIPYLVIISPYLNITDELGCSHYEKIKVMGSNVDLEDIYTLTPTVNEGSGIILFPNPSLGDITLEYNPEHISMIQLVALNGSKNLVFPAESHGRMSMQDLPKGEYVVKFYNGNQLVSTERLSVV